MDLGDPTSNTDEMESSLVNKLAKMITYAEEALQSGDGSVDSDEFFNKRGNFLDMLDDEEIAEFMDVMRKQGRAPFKRYGVGS
jgi:hypothetical protein